MENNDKNTQVPQSLKTAVIPCFSLEDILGIYVFVEKQRELIRDKKNESENDIEKQFLTLTSNVLANVLNEIYSLVELRENKV